MDTRRKFISGAAQSSAKTFFSFFDAVAKPFQGVAGAEATKDIPARSSRKWLRPPGALDEIRFLEVCTRCDECLKACPKMAIRKAGHEYGPALQGTPIILPLESACKLCKGLKCIPVCEPGALLPVEKNEVRMGLAYINEAKCYAHQEQPCDYCVSKCPLKREAIHFDENRRPVIREEGCVGCGICAEWCPPEAVQIVPHGWD